MSCLPRPACLVVASPLLLTLLACSADPSPPIEDSSAPPATATATATEPTTPPLGTTTPPATGAACAPNGAPRLVVRFRYADRTAKPPLNGIAFVVFVGTHSEYDKTDIASL